MAQNITILIATGLYPPDVGGPATFSKLLMEELPKRGFGVSVVSFGEVRHLPKVVRHVVYFFKILKRGKHADVIFAQDPVSVGFPAFFAALLLRKRFILKVVGDYAWEQWMQRQRRNTDIVTPEAFQKRRYDILTQLRRSMERFVARRAHKLIVPSNYLKSIVMYWGVDEKKISVIYNSLKIPKNIAEKKALRGVLQFEGTLLISTGRLVPWKGYQTIIELIPRLRRRFPDIKLLIVGSGPLEEHLQKIIVERSLEKHVVLTGPLEHDLLLRYIKAADLFVLNTFYEGFSHTLLEVMAVGTPLLTTDVGGNPELIQHGKEGMLVNYNDKKALEKAIIKILSNKALGKTLTENARKRVQEFSEEKMITHILQVLQ